jgi:hypothetical protein
MNGNGKDKTVDESHRRPSILSWVLWIVIVVVVVWVLLSVWAIRSVVCDEILCSWFDSC